MSFSHHFLFDKYCWATIVHTLVLKLKITIKFMLRKILGFLFPLESVLKQLQFSQLNCSQSLQVIISQLRYACLTMPS